MEAWLAEKQVRDIEVVIMFVALAQAIVSAIGLFILLPAILSGLIRPYVESSIAVNLTEGLVRLGIFLIYLILVSKMEDIRRIFEYHGAEHKTIHCYEHDEELTVENARKYTTLHPRCGTAFLLIVMVISIVVFSFMGWQNIFIRVLSRLMLLPLVAGLAYEVTRIAAIMYPGLIVQKLTTRGMDDAQLEVAIRAFLEAAGDLLKEEGEPEGETESQPFESVKSRAAAAANQGSGDGQAGI